MMSAEKLSDEWCTPQALFDELNKEFNFDIDLCATKENRKCAAWFNDYLKGDFAFIENGVLYDDINDKTRVKKQE